VATDVLRTQPGVFAMRILDGTPTTPKAITVGHVQPDTAFDLRDTRPQGITILNQGVIDGYTVVVPGTDEFVAQGMTVTFSFFPDFKTYGAVLAAMSNSRNATITANAWPVGTGTFTKANGTGDDIFNGAGDEVPVPQSGDPLHMRVHVEMLLTNMIGGANVGWRFEECYFESVPITLGQFNAPVRATFRRFGQLKDITAFTTVADQTPAL
jgi:hypothetical protein